MNDDTVVCPHCGSEFQPHVLTCIDCGTATVPASHVECLVREEPGPSSLALGSGTQAALVRMAESAWATGLGSYLEEKGVSCGLVEDPACCGPSKLAVVVAEHDLERARELDREYFLQLVPEASESFDRLPGQDECPACGAYLPGGVAECPACGLVVGAAEG